VFQLSEHAALLEGALNLHGYLLTTNALRSARGRAQSCSQMYERRGFPKVDPDMWGRYVPAIRAFFDGE
jgi:hypothetical protein